MNWTLTISYQQLIWRENTRNMQMKTANRRNTFFASPNNWIIVLSETSKVELFAPNLFFGVNRTSKLCLASSVDVWYIGLSWRTSAITLLSSNMFSRIIEACDPTGNMDTVQRQWVVYKILITPNFYILKTLLKRNSHER